MTFKIIDEQKQKTDDETDKVYEFNKQPLPRSKRLIDFIDFIKLESDKRKKELEENKPELQRVK